MTGVQTCALPICTAIDTKERNDLVRTPVREVRASGRVDGRGLINIRSAMRYAEARRSRDETAHFRNIGLNVDVRIRLRENLAGIESHEPYNANQKLHNSFPKHFLPFPFYPSLIKRITDLK